MLKSTLNLLHHFHYFVPQIRWHVQLGPPVQGYKIRCHPIGTVQQIGGQLFRWKRNPPPGIAGKWCVQTSQRYPSGEEERVVCERQWVSFLWCKKNLFFVIREFFPFFSWSESWWKDAWVFSLVLFSTPPPPGYASAENHFATGFQLPIDHVGVAWFTMPDSHASPSLAEKLWSDFSKTIWQPMLCWVHTFVFIVM